MDTWMEKTSLFQQWQRVKCAVDDHKWYESERAGHDIGWDRAYTDWLVRYSGHLDRGAGSDS